MDLTFFTHPSYDGHAMHDGHPECPGRTQAILAHLGETGQLADFKQRRPNAVTLEALKRVHDPSYLVRPNLVHTPLRAGTDGPAFRKAIERDWPPAVAAFQPQILFVSAGFDAHTADPLGDIHLNEDDFTWITKLIVSLANDHCDGRIISTLEGGYHLEALSKSVAAHLAALQA
jgi:acetoin utilization deacetylase AcuC-like enzyme